MGSSKGGVRRAGMDFMRFHPKYRHPRLTSPGASLKILLYILLRLRSRRQELKETLKIHLRLIRLLRRERRRKRQAILPGRAKKPFHKFPANVLAQLRDACSPRRVE